MDDAFREHTKLIQWLRSSDGVRGVYRFYFDFYSGSWPASLPDEQARWQHSDMTASASADSLQQWDPIWCDPPMVDLLAAAADSYPVEPMQPHHLLSLDGIVLFAKPMPVVWHDAEGTQAPQRLSAISWGEGRSTSDGQPLMGITGWERGTGLATYGEPTFTVRYTGLRPVSNAIGPYGAQLPDLGVAGPHQLLQTLTALCRTPLVRSDVAPASKAARQQRTRAGLPDPPIRRIYLRRPEHGTHEIDAARAARTGLPSRGHWVRGHWKNQWHPSLDEHRMTWIAGYPRGDFNAGSITGSRVLVASDPAPRDQEPSR